MQLADSHTTTFSANTINNPKEHYSILATEEAEEESTHQMLGC